MQTGGFRGWPPFLPGLICPLILRLQPSCKLLPCSSGGLSQKQATQTPSSSRTLISATHSCALHTTARSQHLLGGWHGTDAAGIHQEHKDKHAHESHGAAGVLLACIVQYAACAMTAAPLRYTSLFSVGAYVFGLQLVCNQLL